MDMPEKVREGKVKRSSHDVTYNIGEEPKAEDKLSILFDSRNSRVNTLLGLDTVIFSRLEQFSLSAFTSHRGPTWLEELYYCLLQSCHLCDASEHSVVCRRVSFDWCHPG